MLQFSYKFDFLSIIPADMSGYKRKYNYHNFNYKEKEPECLIIPTDDGTEIMLVPVGNIDGSTLYVESHDLPEHEDGTQEPGLHSGGSKDLRKCLGA